MIDSDSRVKQFRVCKTTAKPDDSTIRRSNRAVSDQVFRSKKRSRGFSFRVGVLYSRSLARREKLCVRDSKLIMDPLKAIMNAGCWQEVRRSRSGL